jgi:hypothetical protein
MIVLSIKLQERVTLNTRGSFPEFVSNVIIADDVIRAHKVTKKRKAMETPSGSAPPKYWMVYHHRPTYPPHHQHQHPRQLQQWASRPPLQEIWPSMTLSFMTIWNLSLNNVIYDDFCKPILIYEENIKMSWFF